MAAKDNITKKWIASELVCEQCVKPFLQKSARNTKFCSKKCGQRNHFLSHPEIYLRKKVKYETSDSGNIFTYSRCPVSFNTCVTCGNPFTSKRKRKYCSRKCDLEARKTYYKQIKQIYVSVAVKELRKCKCCGKEFETKTSRQIHCTPKCHQKAYGKTHKKRALHYGVTYEPVNKLKVLERDGWKCQICGKHTPRELIGTTRHNAPELDHRIPISKGGPHTYGNTQCACRTCNINKGNRTEAGQIALFGAIQAPRAYANP